MSLLSTASSDIDLSLPNGGPGDDEVASASSSHYAGSTGPMEQSDSSYDGNLLCTDGPFPFTIPAIPVSVSHGIISIPGCIPMGN